MVKYCFVTIWHIEAPAGGSLRGYLPFPELAALVEQGGESRAYLGLGR